MAYLNMWCGYMYVTSHKVVFGGLLGELNRVISIVSEGHWHWNLETVFGTNRPQDEGSKSECLLARTAKGQRTDTLMRAGCWL